MKKFRISFLVIAAVLFAFALASCGGLEEIPLKILVKGSDDTVLYEHVYTYTGGADNANVLYVTAKMLEEKDIPNTVDMEDGKIYMIDSLTEDEDYYWVYTIDGAEAGAAKSQPVSEGVEIVWKYTRSPVYVTVQILDTEGNQLYTSVKETDGTVTEEYEYNGDNPTVYNVTKKMLEEYKIKHTMDATLTSIDSLAEDEDQTYYWDFTVNGEESSKSSRKHILKSGDVLVWQYLYEAPAEPTE